MPTDCPTCHGTGTNWYLDSDTDTCPWCAGLGVELTPEQLFLTDSLPGVKGEQRHEKRN